MTQKATHIPKLRFPEFEGEWDQVSLKEKSFKPSYGLNAAATTFDGKHKYIRITDIDEESRLYAPSNLTSPEGEISPSYKLEQGDLLFARTGASVGKTYLYNPDDGDLYFAGFLIRFRLKNCEPHFVFSHTLTYNFRKWVSVMSMRSGQPGINAEEYSTFKFYSPKLLEQQKIASFLTSVDQKIEKLQRKKDLLTDYKKGMMQKLFSQKLRFKDDQGNDFPEWEQLSLYKVLELRLRPEEKPQTEYLSIGVRSHMKGTFQKPNSDPEKISMETLYVVKEDDLVVNITFAWEGALAMVKKSDHGGYVSHRFPTYITKSERLNSHYLGHIIKTANMKYALDCISPGGAGRNRVLSKKDFLKILWTFPAVKEQQKIAAYLTALDKKIELVDKKLSQAQSFKKGLLQQMFV